MKTLSLKFFHPKDGGFNLVLHNGFLYKEKQLIKNGYLLRCVNDGCPSRLATNFEKSKLYEIHRNIATTRSLNILPTKNLGNNF